MFGAIAEAMAADLLTWGAQRVDAQVITGAGHYVADEQPVALAELIAARAG